MSRAEKARAEKKRTGKKFRIGFLIIGILLVAAAAALYLFLPESDWQGSLEAPGLIDLERSSASADFLGLVHVFVFLGEGIEADSVTAGGQQLAYNYGEGFWTGVLGGYAEGDAIEVTAYLEGKKLDAAKLEVKDLALEP